MRRLPPDGDDSGYVAILVAVCLPLFVGLCALAFDVASWRVTASRVQSAADAAALGGTIYLPDDRITAFETAEELVAKNGFSGDDVVVTPEVVDSRRQLRVTVSVTVDNTFGGLFGHGETTVTRTAVAEFAGPVPMGSPCNVLGNENMEGLQVGSAACSGQQGTYWLNVAGTDTNKVNGDAYGSGYCTQPYAAVIDGCSSIAPGGGIWGSPPNNTDHTGGSGSGAFVGYLFGVRVQAPVGELDIQGFDLPWVAVGDTCSGDALDGAAALVDPNPYVDDAAARYAGGEGPFCTGDSQMGEPQGEPDSQVRTVVRLYAPSPSPSNPLAGQLLCATELPGWGNNTALVNALDATKPAYDETLARTFRQWASICPAPIASPELGTYVVQVLTVGGGGQNRFALRATAGSSTVNDALGLFALGRVSFFNSVPAGTSDFYLARLGSDSAGRSLTLGFFDLADATTPVQVTLLQPDSDVPFADCVSTPQEGATGTGPLNGCTITTTPGTNGGRWQLVHIQVPSTYRCAADAIVSACWSRVRLSTAAGQNDTTTWRASLDGDPVRLVE